MADDPHGDLKVLADPLQRCQGVGIVRRSGVLDQGGQRFLALREEAVDCSLDMLGADLVEGNPELQGGQRVGGRHRRFQSTSA